MCYLHVFCFALFGLVFYLIHDLIINNKILEQYYALYALTLIFIKLIKM